MKFVSQLKKLSIVLLIFISLLQFPFVISLNNNKITIPGFFINDISAKVSALDSEQIIVAEFTGCYQLEIPYNKLNQTHWYVHIPIISEYQCPVFLQKVWSTPVDIISSYRINSQDFSGDNYMLELNFTQIPVSGTYKIFWTISIFIKYNTDRSLPSIIPKAELMQLPNDTISWLSSSEFIQSTHPEIQSKANSLSGTETNAITIVENIMSYTTYDVEYGVNPLNYSQDALSSLRREQAICTGKANLATALLRACGIPARVQMIYPTHYITECYLYPYGWIRIEPTGGMFVLQPFLIPSNSFEAFYLYVEAYCAYLIDESSTNIVNGFAPLSDGVIAYWLSVDESINFTIDIINDWTIDCNTFGGANESVTTAFSITQEVWELLLLYNENKTWNQLKDQFPLTFNRLSIAQSYLKQGKLASYLDLMEDILCKLYHNNDNYNCGLDFIFSYDILLLILIGGITIPLLLYSVSKKKKTYNES